MFVPRPHVLPRYASSSEPGVKWVWRHEDSSVLPARQREAVADLCRRLGVSPSEVSTELSKTVEGHTRIAATWQP